MSAKKKLVREKFRTAVFERDGHQCRIPGCTVRDNLDAHHITDRTLMPNGGYVRENGITVCHDHHMAAEAFHISGGEEWVEGLHPNDLYAMIGSTYEKAIRASERL